MVRKSSAWSLEVVDGAVELGLVEVDLERVFGRVDADEPVRGADSASSWSATCSATASPAWTRVSLAAAWMSASAASTSSVLVAAYSWATAAP